MQKLMNFRTLALTCVKAIITSHAFSQAPGVQDKLAALKESAAQNKQRLMHYDWTGILCALGVFALLLLSHLNASAQSLPSCAWRLEIIGGSGIFNAFYPDTDASYWVMPVDTTQWKQVILQGQYPQSRFFSFTTYVAKGSTVDSIYDINIDPDAGSSNPFRRGSSTGQLHNYTVNVGGPSGQTNHVNFGDTRLAWIVYRIYVPNRGLDPMAGVPLPAVTLVDANGGKHSIAPCNAERDQQINLLIDDLRDHGFYELADYWQTKFTDGDDRGRAPDSCQPEDQVVFWIPKNTGGFFPNPYNGYIGGPDLCFHPGKFVIVRGKAADFPDTYNGNPVWQPALPGYIQLRYWSMCNNNQVAPYPVVACQPDHATNLDSHGYYTYVLGEGDSPPSWLPVDATWLPWGSRRVSNILIFRNMLPTTPQFERSVQAAIDAGCVVDNQLNTTPPRDQVIKAGACAQRVMKAFYPKAVFCDESVFEHGGWQACFGQ